MVSNDKGKVRVTGNLPQVIAENCQLITDVFITSYQSVAAEDLEGIRSDMFHALSTVIADILMAMKETDNKDQAETFDFHIGDETDMTDLLKRILKEDE